MTLPVSGAISFNAINVELGVAGTTQANINQASYRTLAGVPSGQISLSNFYGKSSRVTANVTISANTANYVLNTAKAPGYIAGITDMILTINSGVIVSSSSTGTAALIVNTSWAAGDTVRINNGGVILGKGGNGGNGSSGGASTSGTSGGLALQVQRALTMNNTNRIAGGGGGGGGGGLGQYIDIAGGGGGGGGIGIGTGGSAGGYGSGVGVAGTLTSAGSGGNGGSNVYSPGPKYGPTPIQGGAGGAGGTYGSNGSGGANGNPVGNTPGSGGAAGACITGNSFITYVATGTRNGAIS